MVGHRLGGRRHVYAAEALVVVTVTALMVLPFVASPAAAVTASASGVSQVAVAAAGPA